MIELEREVVNLKKYGGLTGTRDKNEEPQRLVEIPFVFVGSNDYLSMLDPSLKSCLYKKDDQQEVFEESDNHMTVSRFSNIFDKVSVKSAFGSIKGAEFIIHYGINDSSDIVIDNATVTLKDFIKQDGGTCIFNFLVKGEASTADVGRIHQVMSSDVEVTFRKPTSPQAPLELA